MHIWPQITMLALITLGAGHTIAKFGERKTDTYGWTELVIAPAITLTLLYCGGFFAPLGI
jgi:hypothetical protein